jgi:Spy/CpxP family protein refolding chaperone
VVSFGKVTLVVLATVVIFAAGVLTGGLLVRRPPRVEMAQPFWNRFEMTRRAVDHLPDVTPEQRQRIDDIIRDNRELIADYFRILEPDVQQIFRRMREGIREELTPDQRRRFEELARNRLPRIGDRRPQDGFNSRPNLPGPFGPDGPANRPMRRSDPMGPPQERRTSEPLPERNSQP